MGARRDRGKPPPDGLGPLLQGAQVNPGPAGAGTPTAAPVWVAIAIIESEGHVLSRPRDALDGLLAGLWEFPGGKVLPSETLQAAAAREFLEETGIAPPPLARLCLHRHSYADGRDLELSFWLGHLAGRPPARRGEWRWLPWSGLAPDRIPAANRIALGHLEAWRVNHAATAGAAATAFTAPHADQRPGSPHVNSAAG